ncbi:hypothetical protein ACH5RR_006101 [Cinchona calisaya]|uniref:Uncharacterized protein n=1 Tax=Cinchona calisaya TaxID=153742 RepID=A0ABD3AN13_9GENT
MGKIKSRWSFSDRDSILNSDPLGELDLESYLGIIRIDQLSSVILFRGKNSIIDHNFLIWANIIEGIPLPQNFNGRKYECPSSLHISNLHSSTCRLTLLLFLDQGLW